MDKKLKITKIGRTIRPKKPNPAETTTRRRRSWAAIGGRTAAVLLVGFFSITNHLSAQNSFGTIVGTVVDQSGAAVVGASVKVTNTATGVVDSVRTQSDGNYTAINLIPGPYVVSVESSGFSETQTYPVNLTVNQTLRADLTLHPGTVDQTVKVSATEILLDTDSSTVSSEISNEQVADMPLSSRNFMSLLELTPGTILEPSGSGFGTDQSGFRTSLSGGAAFVGGGRSSSNGYLIDGIENNDPGFQTPTITVPIDGIQDMRLMTKDYSAEYGGSASQVNIATKSGTNEFHGTAYEFFQNDDLNATNQTFGNPAIKPVLRYNQFGESFGGPIWIPKIVNGHNKLFFFTDYEGLRTHTTGTQFGLFPTAAELSGNFSGDPTIYNPATGLPFAGNQITSIDPVAAKVISLGFFATPNIPLTATGVNTKKALLFPDNVDEWMIRGDYKISPKDSLFVRYSESTQNVTNPTVSPFDGTISRQLGKNIGIDYTRIISPNLVNELRIGVNRPISIQGDEKVLGGANIAGELFKGIAGTPATFGAPQFGFSSGFTQVGGNANTPLDYTTTAYDLGDNLTIIKGAHTIEVGAAGRHVFFKEINAYEPNGIVNFNGEYTAGALNPNGNPIADFLLGLTDNASLNEGNYTGRFNAFGYSFFGQDDWKVTKRLTLNLGIRYEYLAPFQEEHNLWSIFNPAGDNLLTPDSAIVTQLNNPLIGLDPSSYLFNPDHKNFAPRVGFSYRPFGRTVVRAGYGIFYDTTENNEYIFGVLDPPFSKSYGGGGTVASPLSVDNLFPIAPTSEPAAGMGVLSLDQNNKTPYVEQWNFGIEHELPRNSVVEIAYSGSSSTHLNERWWPTQGVLSNPGPSATVKFLYPNMGYVLADSTRASANYNSAMVRFEKRFDKGYSFLAHYTYSHALGDSSSVGGAGADNPYPQNGWDLQGDYGSLAFDVKNSFLMSGSWELPFGKGKALMNNVPNAANLLIGGWQLNGIYQVQSGFPFYVPAPFDNSGTIFDDAPRAKVVGNPAGPDSVHPGRAFNTQAFAEPAPGTFGNENIAELRGKGINNVDFSMFKNNHFSERVNFQLRVEAFNAFNHTQPGFYPNTTIANTGVGLYSSLAHQARILQVAGKIVF